ncbi:hypothetical protein GGF31_001851 [Allomyces arbusculus]|nr:hypothetical protein GGF31_001851 [Allomyces arbusculus]
MPRSFPSSDSPTPPPPAPPVRGVPPSAPAFLTPARANRALNAPGRHVRAEGVLAVNAVLRALVATWVQVAATLTEHGTPPLRAEALEASLPQLIGRPVLDRAVDGARAACAVSTTTPHVEPDVEQVIPRAVTAAVVDEALVPFPAFRPPPDDAVTYVTGALAAIVMYLFDVLRHHDHPASTTDHDLIPATVGVDEVARALADDPGLVAAYVNLDLGSLLDALVAAIRPRPMSGVALTPDSPSARTASPPPLTSTSRSASPAPTTDACESTPSTPARSRPASMERRRSFNAASAPPSGARGSRMSEVMTPSPGSLPRRPSAPVADPAKADEFESLLLSDETKKISLTPDRLRSMEPSPGLGPIATPPSTPPTTRRTSRRPGSMLVPVAPDLAAAAAAAGLPSPSPRTELPDPFASAASDPVANDSAVLNAQRASVVVAALTTGVGAAAAALVATGADQSAATGNISSDEEDDFLPNGRPRSGISGGNGAARRSSAAELTEFFNTTVPPSLSSAASVSTLEPTAAEGAGKSKKKRIFSMFGGATKRDKDKHRLSGGAGSPQLLTSQASIDSATTAAAAAAAKKYTMLPVPPGVDVYQPGAPPPNLVFADAGTIHTAPVAPRAASAPILARAASDARAPPILNDDDGGPPPVARSSSLARSDSARAALARWGARDVADASPPPPASLGSSPSSSASASARRGSAPPLRIMTAALSESPVVAPAAEDDGPPPPRRRTSLRSAFADVRHGTRAIAVDPSATDSDRPSFDIDSSDMDRRASTPPLRTSRRRSGPQLASTPQDDPTSSLATATRSDLEALVCDLQARLAAAELARANADRAAAKAARKLHDMASAVAARNATIAALQAENAELAHRLHSVLRVLAKAVPGLPVAEGGAGGTGSAASSRRGSPGPAGLVAAADA